MKTSEEVPDAFEEIEEGIIACTNSNSGLVVIQQGFYHNDLDEKCGMIRTARRTSTLTKIAFVGWSGT